MLLLFSLSTCFLHPILPKLLVSDQTQHPARQPDKQETMSRHHHEDEIINRGNNKKPRNSRDTWLKSARGHNIKGYPSCSFIKKQSFLSTSTKRVPEPVVHPDSRLPCPGSPCGNHPPPLMLSLRCCEAKCMWYPELTWY
jgi:hypothetical protein